MRTNPTQSYYTYRANVVPGGFGFWPDITVCAAKSDDCPSCLACCDSTYPLSAVNKQGKPINTRSNQRCKLRCQLKFGSGCGSSGGPAPSPSGGSTCGIVCWSGGGTVGQHGNCGYDCSVPPSQIPIGTQVPTSAANIPILVNYPTQGTNVIDTSTGTSVDTTGTVVDTGGSLLNTIMAHPLLTLMLIGGGVYAYKKWF